MWSAKNYLSKFKEEENIEKQFLNLINKFIEKYLIKKKIKNNELIYKIKKKNNLILLKKFIKDKDYFEKKFNKNFSIKKFMNESNIKKITEIINISLEKYKKSKNK